MKGQKITTLNGLIQAARRKQAVVFERAPHGVLPAAFVQNWPGHCLWWHFKRGMYVYKKEG